MKNRVKETSHFNNLEKLIKNSRDKLFLKVIQFILQIKINYITNYIYISILDCLGFLQFKIILGYVWIKKIDWVITITVIVLAQWDLKFMPFTHYRNWSSSMRSTLIRFLSTILMKLRWILFPLVMKDSNQLIHIFLKLYNHQCFDIFNTLLSRWLSCFTWLMRACSVRNAIMVRPYGDVAELEIGGRQRGVSIAPRRAL